MTQYLIKFIFYTSGVIGLLLIAYVFAKSFLNGNMMLNKKKGNLEIEESLAISPRKTLHIVKAFNEKFLVASDANSTTLLAKLNANGEIEQAIETPYPESYNDKHEDFELYMEQKTPNSNTKSSNSVIHSMLEKLNN